MFGIINKSCIRNLFCVFNNLSFRKIIYITIYLIISKFFCFIYYFSCRKIISITMIIRNLLVFPIIWVVDKFMVSLLLLGLFVSSSVFSTIWVVEAFMVSSLFWVSEICSDKVHPDLSDFKIHFEIQTYLLIFFYSLMSPEIYQIWILFYHAIEKIAED